VAAHTARDRTRIPSQKLVGVQCTCLSNSELNETETTVFAKKLNQTKTERIILHTPTISTVLRQKAPSDIFLAFSIFTAYDIRLNYSSPVKFSAATCASKWFF